MVSNVVSRQAIDNYNLFDTYNCNTLVITPLSTLTQKGSTC